MASSLEPAQLVNDMDLRDFSCASALESPQKVSETCSTMEKDAASEWVDSQNVLAQDAPVQLMRKVWFWTDSFFKSLPSYYDVPISLRNPYIFYMGHLPAFAQNTLEIHLSIPPQNPYLQNLFYRGKDPDVDDPTKCHGHSQVPDQWPSVNEIQTFTGEVRKLILSLELTQGIHRAIFEHDGMHLETLFYMRAQANENPIRIGQQREVVQDSACQWVTVKGGDVKMGEKGLDTWEGFKWDNEWDERVMSVDRFKMGKYAVTNSEFVKFIEAGGYERADLWGDDWNWVRTKRFSMPSTWRKKGGQYYVVTNIGFGKAHDGETGSWPVCASLAEADAYAKWRNARVATEAEWLLAAGKEESTWESRPSTGQMNVFKGRENEHGFVGMVGNGWELTSTVFDSFPGFTATTFYQQYSADFFDGKHFALRGASWATMPENVRWSFRNYYQRRYRYMFAKFRVVKDD